MAHTEDSYVLDILRLEGLLRAYLHRFAPKPTDLEDLLQETYTHLLSLSNERRAQIQAMQPFVLTTARNIAVDWVRRRKVIPIDLVDDLDTFPFQQDAPGVEEIVNAHQELLRLAAAVDDLPTRCAEVFTLRKVYGWSQREIADHFGISISTVEAHLVKAVRRCTERVPKTPRPALRPLRWLQGLRRTGSQQ